MKIFFSLISIAFLAFTFFDVSTYNILILPKSKLNQHFSIIGSISGADSINDQYARPLYNNLQNQFYFQDYNSHVVMMQPNIGIAQNKDNVKNTVNDVIIYRLTKYFSINNFVVFDISPLIKKNFFYKINRKNFFTEKNLYYIEDDKVVNIDVNYYDKIATYSFFFHDDSLYKPKISNLKYGYFLTLSKTYKHNGSETKHLIARWDCNEPINIYIDKSVPEIYLDVFKNGIEEWNSAFTEEKIDCVINAISYKDKNWKKFKYGDSRYSTISLSPSSLDSTYAVGHIDFDWRNGRIFKGNIMVSRKWVDYWANVYNYLLHIRNINYNLTSKNKCIDERYIDNNRSQNEFIKKGLKSVIIHEMGHILGLRHNFKASSLVSYEEIFSKKRINEEGLIPSIMDYLSYILNSKKIINCIDIKCLLNNVKIMDKIGKYDKQTIQFGYGDIDKISYYLGPDEMYGEDPLSNTGDISNSPTRYYDDDLNISKYIINNFDLVIYGGDENFNSKWKKEGKLIINHLNKLMSYTSKSINLLTRISYNFDGSITNIKDSQAHAAIFLKNVGEGKYFIKNKKYFIYDDCDIKGNFYCQGMTSFDLLNLYEKILDSIQNILNSYNFREVIEKNHFLTNKTISLEKIIKIFNN